MQIPLNVTETYVPYVETCNFSMNILNLNWKVIKLCWYKTNELEKVYSLKKLDFFGSFQKSLMLQEAFMQKKKLLFQI